MNYIDSGNKMISFDVLNNYNVINIYTLKPYDFSRKNVSESKIKEYFNNIERQLNFKFFKIIKPGQMHSNNVKIVNKKNLNDTFNNVDGLITNLKGVALITYLADCEGILLFDKNSETSALLRALDIYTDELDDYLKKPEMEM